MSIILQIVYLLLYILLLVLAIRYAMTLVLGFGRRWRPGRGAAAGLEVVWTVTDPPLKALRRVIPPLRVGNVNLDLASVALWLILLVLLSLVKRYV